MKTYGNKTVNGERVLREFRLAFPDPLTAEQVKERTNLVNPYHSLSELVKSGHLEKISSQVQGTCSECGRFLHRRKLWRLKR